MVFGNTETKQHADMVEDEDAAFTLNEQEQVNRLYGAITTLGETGSAFVLVQVSMDPNRRLFWSDCCVRRIHEEPDTSDEPFFNDVEVCRITYSGCVCWPMRGLALHRWSNPLLRFVLCRMDRVKPPLLLPDQRSGTSLNLRTIVSLVDRPVDVQLQKGLWTLQKFLQYSNNVLLGDLLSTDPDVTAALSHVLVTRPPHGDCYNLLTPTRDADRLLQQPGNVTLTRSDMLLIWRCQNFWTNTDPDLTASP